MRTKVWAIAVAAALAVAAPVFAHHGSAAYDMQKTVTARATVTSLTWANPHCLLNFDTTEPTGEVKHWHIEMYNPEYMIRAGWNRNLLKAGDEITVTFHPARNGSGNGLVRSGDTKIIYNGKQLSLNDNDDSAN